jgi:pyruvate dehydrogenase E1 component alpha subunit
MSVDKEQGWKELSKERLVSSLGKMLLVRNFETRAESAYQHGFVGGFFHSYIGQEAIMASLLEAAGEKNWWITTYRCHAQALLLGATPNEIMAELYGRSTGNALGRGGSMHLYTERLLGGFAIVGGHLPIAAGAAFSLKYQNNKNEIAICFLGDGAVAQGTFHETLNLCSLWELPVLFLIENNQWGMGTHVSRALSIKRLAEDTAPAYGLKGYTLNGMDFIHCYTAFKQIIQEIKQTQKPVLVEVMTERFKGHSISDPALYRKKEELKKIMEKDPITLFSEELIARKVIDEAGVKTLNEEKKQLVLEAMKFAEESPWPHESTLEEGVFKE